MPDDDERVAAGLYCGRSLKEEGRNAGDGVQLNYFLRARSAGVLFVLDA